MTIECLDSPILVELDCKNISLDLQRQKATWDIRNLSSKAPLVKTIENYLTKNRPSDPIRIVGNFHKFNKSDNFERQCRKLKSFLRSKNQNCPHFEKCPPRFNRNLSGKNVEKKAGMFDTK